MTKLTLAIYPAMLMTSLHLTGRGMADQHDVMPRSDEWVWLLGIAVGVPIVHLCLLRNIKYDRMAYRITAWVGIPFIILPFFGLVVGLGVYGLLTYLLYTRGRREV